MPECCDEAKIEFTTNRCKTKQASKPTRMVLPKKPWNRITMQFTKRSSRKQQAKLQKYKRDHRVERANTKSVPSLIELSRNGLLAKTTSSNPKWHGHKNHWSNTNKQRETKDLTTINQNCQYILQCFKFLIWMARHMEAKCILECNDWWDRVEKWIYKRHEMQKDPTKIFISSQTKNHKDR